MWYDFSRWAQSNREKDVKRLKKLSRGAYEDTKGSVRALEALIEVALLTSAYYLVWRNLYDFSMFAYKGKYVLAGVYAALMLLFFVNTECTKFGQLHWTDLVVGQVISLLLVNAVTYFQLCLIANEMISVVPMLVLTVLETVLALLATIVFDKLYHIAVGVVDIDFALAVVRAVQPIEVCHAVCDAFRVFIHNVRIIALYTSSIV